MSAAAAELGQHAYSTVEVCGLLGISYRVLDYWIRTGAVRVSRATPGSGRHRLFTEEEYRRLAQMVQVYRDAHVMLHRVRSGELWESLR